MNILDLAFYQENNLNTPDEVLNRHAGNWEHYSILAKDHKCFVIKFAPFKNQIIERDIQFRFLPKQSFLIIQQLSAILKWAKPDVIITHSFKYPIQTFFLILLKPKDCKVIAQHHGDRPRRNPFWLVIQKMVYSKVNAVSFVSRKQAFVFKDAGIIGKKTSIVEIMEGSSSFTSTKRNQKQNSNPNIVSIGRLNALKDHFTILKAFSRWKDFGGKFKLEIYYTENTLERDLQKFISEKKLDDQVRLCGKVPHVQIEDILNKADYFISASQYESAGFALSEAMACGCVPLLSAIPSHQKMAGSDKTAWFFPVSDVDALYNILIKLNEEDRIQKSKAARRQFEKQLSFAAIAHDTDVAIKSLFVH